MKKLNKPKIYFAGKCNNGNHETNRDWRYSIVDFHDINIFCGEDILGTEAHEFTDFIYTGPFLIEDHCWDNEELIERCMKGIEESDVVFCWIDSVDCYGTLTELGYAKGKGIKTYAYYHKALESDEHWFAKESAYRYGTAKNSTEAFAKFWQEYKYEPVFESPIEQKLYTELKAAVNKIPHMRLETQKEILNYRVDIAILKNEEPIYAIECDGHEFHERTKEQAARDKKRDRELLRLGMPTIRFTGTEINSNVKDCVYDIIQLLNREIAV